MILTNLPIKKLEQEKKKHEKIIATINGLIKERKQAKLILCEHCRKRTRLDKLIFAQNHWYDENTGSPCGGFWKDDDDNSYFICTKCEGKNRMYGREDIKLLLENTHLFKAIWRHHDYGHPHGVKITKPGDARY